MIQRFLLAALLLAPTGVFGQSMCGGLISPQCLQRLGAGPVVTSELCAAELDAYRACVKDLAAAAPPPGPTPPRGAGCSATVAQSLWESAAQLDSCAAYRGMVEACPGTPQASMAARLAQDEACAALGVDAAPDRGASFELVGDAIGCEMAFTLIDTVNGTTRELRGEPTIAFVEPDGRPSADGLLDLRREGRIVRARIDANALMEGHGLAFHEAENRFEIDLQSRRLEIALELIVRQGALSGAILARGGGPCVWR